MSNKNMGCVSCIKVVLNKLIHKLIVQEHEKKSFLYEMKLIWTNTELQI